MFSRRSSDYRPDGLSSTWWANYTDSSAQEASTTEKKILRSDNSDTRAEGLEKQWWNDLAQNVSIPIKNRTPTERKSDISINITAGENDSGKARNNRLTMKRRAKKVENRFLQSMSDWKRQSSTLLNQSETVINASEDHEDSKNSRNEESVETQDKPYLFKRKLRSAKYRFSKVFDHQASSASVIKRETGSIEGISEKNTEQSTTSTEAQKSNSKFETLKMSHSSKKDTRHPSEAFQIDEHVENANEPSENEQYLINTCDEERLEETNQIVLRSQKRLFGTTDIKRKFSNAFSDEKSHGNRKVELQDKRIEDASEKDKLLKIHKTDKTQGDLSISNHENHSQADVTTRKPLFKKATENKRKFSKAFTVENSEDTSVNKEQLFQVSQTQNSGNPENRATKISPIDETEEQQDVDEQESFLNDYGLIKNTHLSKTPAANKRQFSQAFNVELSHQATTVTPKEKTVDKHSENLFDYVLTEVNQQGQQMEHLENISNQENSKGISYDLRNKKRLSTSASKENKRRVLRVFIDEKSQISNLTRNGGKNQLPQDEMESDRKVPDKNLEETSDSKKGSNEKLHLEESKNYMESKLESVNVTRERSVDELGGQNRLFKPAKETKRQFSEAFNVQETHLNENNAHRKPDTKKKSLPNKSDQDEGIIAKTTEMSQAGVNSRLTQGEKTRKNLFKKDNKSRKFSEAFHETDDSTKHSGTQSKKGINASFSTMPSIEESDEEIEKQVLFKRKTRSATNVNDENESQTMDESNKKVTLVKSRRISVIKARSNHLEAHLNDEISPQDTVSSRWFEASLISSTKVDIKLSEDEKQPVDSEESNEQKRNLQEETLVETLAANKDERKITIELSNKQNLTESNHSMEKRNSKNSLTDNLNNSMSIAAMEIKEQEMSARRGTTIENKQRRKMKRKYGNETYKFEDKEEKSRSTNSFEKNNSNILTTDLERVLDEEVSVQKEAGFERNQQSGPIQDEEENQIFSRNKSKIVIGNTSTKLSGGAEYTRNDQDISLQNENNLLVPGPKPKKSKTTRMSIEHVARKLTNRIESDHVSVNGQTSIEENNQPTSTQTSKHQNKFRKSETKFSSDNDIIIHKETLIEENLSMSSNTNKKHSTTNKPLLETEDNNSKANISFNLKSVEAKKQNQTEQQLRTSNSETGLPKTQLEVAGNTKIPQSHQPRISNRKTNNSVKINSGQISSLRNDDRDFSNKTLETGSVHQKSLVNNQDELKKFSINLEANECPIDAFKKYMENCPSEEAIKKTSLQIKPLTAYFSKLDTKVVNFPTSQKVVASKPVNKVSKVKTVKAVMSEGKVYRPKKLYHKQRWMTPFLYKHLQKKMQKKFEDRTVLQSENLMKELGESVSVIMKSNKYEGREIKQLARKLAENDVVTTMYDFYNFCEEYLPRLFCDKVIPRMQAFKKEPTIPFDPSTLFKKIQY